VDASGRVISVAAGTDSVIASAGGRADTVAVLSRQIAKTLSLTPPSDTLVISDSTALVLTASDSNNVAITSPRYAVTSSNAAVATVDSATLRVRAIATGVDTITVALNGLTARSVILVTGSNLIVTQLVVTPADTLVEGDSATVSFKVKNVGVLRADSTIAGYTAVDAASNTILGGTTRLLSVPALNPGDSAFISTRVPIDTVVAWPDSVKAQILIDYNRTVAETNEGDNTAYSAVHHLRYRVMSVTMAPQSGPFTLSGDTTVWTALGDTVLFTAVARDRYGRVLSDRHVAFLGGSLDFCQRCEVLGPPPPVAVLDTVGTVVSIFNGVDSIAAYHMRINPAGDTTFIFGYGHVRVTQVADSIDLSADSDSLSSIDEQTAYLVQFYDRNGNPASNIVPTWSSSDTLVAVVVPDTLSAQLGVITARGNGTATITVGYNGLTASHRIVVAQVATDIAIKQNGEAIEEITLLPGDSVQLTAYAVDAYGNQVSGISVNWFSVDTTKVRVSNTGMLRALLVGTNDTYIYVNDASNPDLVHNLLVHIVAPANANVIWTGATSTAWATATNFSPNGVPTNSDVVWVRAASANQPVLGGSVSVGGIIIDAGASLNIGSSTLTLASIGYVYGSVISSGGRFSLVQTGTYFGSLPTTDVNGSWSAAGTTSFAGNVVINDNGNFSPGGHTVTVNGNLTLDSHGYLTMADAADVLDVSGNVYWNRQDDNAQSVSAGLIKVQGNFSSGGTASAGFRTSGTHTVLFNGSAAQTVSLAYGDDCRHYFNRIEIANPAGVQFTNHVCINDGVTITSGLATGAVRAHIANYLTDATGDRWQVAATRFYGGTPTLPSAGMKGLLFVNTAMAPTTGFVADSIEIYDGGNLTVNGKNIRVRGNFTMDSHGYLTMANAADVLDVGGNVYWNRQDDNAQTVSAGLIKVQGNFSSGGTASAGFRTSGTHTVLFNGTNAQTASLAYGDDCRHYFNRIEIANAAGVQFTNHVCINDGVTMTNGLATGAVRAHVANYLTDGTGDRWRVAATRFYGGTPTLPAAGMKGLLFVSTAMTPTASFMADSIEIYDGGNLNINGKTIRVRGNFTMDSHGYLTMANAADVLDVGGNVYWNRQDDNVQTVSAGLIKVQGNFSSGGTASAGFRPSGTHTVQFNGSGLQSVNLAYGDDCRHYFNRIEIANAAGVQFTNHACVGDGVTMTNGLATGAVRAHIANYLTDATGDRWQVAATNFYGGTPTLPVAGMKGLLYVSTAMSPTASFTVDSIEIYNGGNLTVNGKNIRVRGNFTMDSNGYLTMASGADVLDVGGNIYWNRQDDNAQTVNAGLIKVQGNFTTGGTASAGFRPNGSHTVLFNGTSAQTVSLAYGFDGRHYFQNAQVQNAAGVTFSNSFTMNGNLNSSGTLTIPGGVTTSVGNNLTLAGVTNNNGTLRYHGTLSGTVSNGPSR
jgi:flagellar basal body rod protein FlgG